MTLQITTLKYLIFCAVTAGCVAVALTLDAGWIVSLVVLLVCLTAFYFVADRPEPAPKVQPEASPESTLPSGFGQALLRMMPAPLIVISSTGRTTYANPAALEILPRYAEGQHFSQLIRAPAFIEAINQVILDGQDKFFTFTTMQDREQYFEARVLRLPSGSEFGTENEVVVQIEDRTRDKLAAQTRSDFIANASHELRTPLASIIGYIETLQGHAKGDAEAQERFLGIMQTQAGRMQRLVDDLMSLSRIEMNAHVRPAELIDFNKIALEVSSALLPLARNEGMQIDCTVPLDAPAQMIRGDHDQLCQVMSNIIDNAIRYGNEGQSIRVFIAKPSSTYPGQVGISVADNGPGIPREHIHRLTERFYRVNVNTSRARGGTGLGLAIVKHILNRHSGAVEIDSTLGEGATFTIWLPQVVNDDSV